MKIYLFLSLFISSFRSQKVSGSESLVNNYRTVFNNIIIQSSYDALVKKLKLKLEQERAASSTKE